MRSLLFGLFSIANAMTLCVAAAIEESEKPQRKDGLVRVHFEYDRAMLMIVAEDAVAAVRFNKPIEKGNDNGNGVVGCAYHWRFLKRDADAIEQTGTGQVFAKFQDGEVARGSFEITCESIQVTWHSSNSKSGTVQYDPRKMVVYLITPDQFGAQNEGDVRVDSKRTPVDLRRFWGRDEAAELANRQLVYNGPEGPNSGSPGQLSAPVTYADSVLVAKNPDGIATFEFGKVFEREAEGNETHYGVSYKFTYKSHSGTVRKSGNGEVYERYINKEYNRGRLHLEAGPVHFEWSRGGSEIGWIYYDPSWLRVATVDSEDVQILIETLSESSTRSVEDQK